LKHRLRLAALLAGRVRSKLRRGFGAVPHAFTLLRAQVPDRLLIAPQDIRTSDPAVAADIYAGYFALGGKIVNAHGRSPFDLESQSPDWARALCGFGWLRHLRAADTALARANARVLVEDFLNASSRPSLSPGWETRVVARRILAWLSQSPIILDGADRDFYRRFMKGLLRAQVFLERALAAGPDGEERLFALIALEEFGLCAQGATKLRRKTTKLLGDELDRQILADGGHISRNPQMLIDLLLDLLPLRQAYGARGQQPPPQLLNAIDRMLPMLRLLRHNDGTLALFNGMGVTAPELLATLLAYDDARAQALTNAPHSGYQRLEAEAALVIVDSGRPPPPAFSGAAHAGCLSFEFSVDAQRLVVNCGVPGSARSSVRQLARMTAAHSTLVIEDMSSCGFAFHSNFKKWLGTAILSGPETVTVERQSYSGAAMLLLSHDGYLPQFGLLHMRRLILAADGTSFAGTDMLERAGRRVAKGTPADFCLRFHIHPNVQLECAEGDRAVLCYLPDGAIWVFEADGRPIRVEESIFFAAPDGARRCEQIVVSGQSDVKAELNWTFQQLERPSPVT